jgi:hypothetical protein
MLLELLRRRVFLGLLLSQRLRREVLGLRSVRVVVVRCCKGWGCASRMRWVGGVEWEKVEIDVVYYLFFLQVRFGFILENVLSSYFMVLSMTFCEACQCNLARVTRRRLLRSLEWLRMQQSCFHDSCLFLDDEEDSCCWWWCEGRKKDYLEIKRPTIVYVCSLIKRIFGPRY